MILEAINVLGSPQKMLMQFYCDRQYYSSEYEIAPPGVGRCELGALVAKGT
jgi:hypothetical protein